MTRKQRNKTYKKILSAIRKSNGWLTRDGLRAVCNGKDIYRNGKLKELSLFHQPFTFYEIGGSDNLKTIQEISVLFCIEMTK